MRAKRDLEISDHNLILVQQTIETAKIQTMAAHQRMLPHRNYIPKVYHDGFSWIAEAVMSEGPSLVGRGENPAAALTDFDSQWLGVEENK